MSSPWPTPTAIRPGTTRHLGSRKRPGKPMSTPTCRSCPTTATSPGRFASCSSRVRTSAVALAACPWAFPLRSEPSTGHVGPAAPLSPRLNLLHREARESPHHTRPRGMRRRPPATRGLARPRTSTSPHVSSQMRGTRAALARPTPHPNRPVEQRLPLYPAWLPAWIGQRLRYRAPQVARPA